MNPKAIKYTSKFKSDMKAYKHNASVCNELNNILLDLQYDLPLPAKYKDHALQGNWKGERDVHVKPDVVLIYHTTNDEVICVRIGKHNKLGLTESNIVIQKLHIKD